jgi:hypothetical protein
VRREDRRALGLAGSIVAGSLTFLGVDPADVHHVIDGRVPGQPGGGVAAGIRLPLPLPTFRRALRVAREP